MTDLKQLKCDACNSLSPGVTSDEIAELKSQLTGWDVIEEEGGLRLEKIYKFPDFQKAIAFTNVVGEEAEKEGHHPALLTEWGKVTVTWWTHALNGLHKNDFIMAAKTDAVKEAS